MNKAIEVVDQKIASLQEKLAQAKALKAKKEALANSRLKKTETRIKFLLGSMVMQEMRENPKVYAEVISKLDTFLVHPSDRKLFGLDTPVSSSNVPTLPAPGLDAPDFDPTPDRVSSFTVNQEAVVNRTHPDPQPDPGEDSSKKKLLKRNKTKTKTKAKPYRFS